MNRKQCPFCGSVSCIRKGFQESHQRWKCKQCHKKFQANKTAPPSKEELFCLYVFNKQTLAEIGSEYGLRTKAVQSFLFAFPGSRAPGGRQPTCKRQSCRQKCSVRQRTAQLFNGSLMSPLEVACCIRPHIRLCMTLSGLISEPLNSCAVRCRTEH